jgi:hypothetical protein
MVIGIDVFHKRGMPSVTGFVASLNPTLTRWFSKVTIQKPNQHMSDSLQICFCTALEHYYAVNFANEYMYTIIFNIYVYNFRQTIASLTGFLSIETVLVRG